MIQLFVPQKEGIKFKKITKTISKTANKVGSEIKKVSMMAIPASARKVLKNMGKIKPALASFMKKTGDIIPIPLPIAVPLVAKKCRT